MKRLAAAVLCLLLTAPAVSARRAFAPQGDRGLKAAFIFNFAKYAEWPGLTTGAPIVACIYGDDRLATALNETVRGQSIDGHAVEVQAPKDHTGFRWCQVLFIGAAELRRIPSVLTGISVMPVLTVSDGKGFANTGGIIEMYVEDGRMHFAINVTAVERSGLRLSSRLLDLARIVRGENVP